MTVQEMADKYGLSYATAFKCTYGIQPVSYRLYGNKGGNQYNESEMVDNLVAMIIEKQAAAKAKIKQLDARIKEVRSIEQRAAKGT